MAKYISVEAAEGRLYTYPMIGVSYVQIEI
jgi:hypothetical protein